MTKKDSTSVSINSAETSEVDQNKVKYWQSELRSGNYSPTIKAVAKSLAQDLGMLNPHEKENKEQ